MQDYLVDISANTRDIKDTNTKIAANTAITIIVVIIPILTTVPIKNAISQPNNPKTTVTMTSGTVITVNVAHLSVSIA